MTLTLTASMAEVGQYLFDLVTDHKGDLGLAEVYYGDQERLPVTPVVCVETGTKERSLNGGPRRTKVDFTVYFLVYHSAIVDAQTQRRAVDEMNESIESLLNELKDLNGLVIHGMVTSTENGYVTKAGSVVRASRLTYEATSQQMLPY